MPLPGQGINSGLSIGNGGKKNKCQHSHHKTTTEFQVKQALHLRGKRLPNVPSSSKQKENLLQTFIFGNLTSNQIIQLAIYLQAFCEAAPQITQDSLCKSFNTTSFPFPSFSPAFPSPSSESFPESDSSPHNRGWTFFLREDSLRPLCCNSSRNVDMGEQNPRRNMKFMF